MKLDIKTVETRSFIFTLTEEEAIHLQTVLGSISGGGPIRATTSAIWEALNLKGVSSRGGVSVNMRLSGD